MYFKAADVFINPVISGGGIQTKIIDALSYHLNVVCFHSKSLGITGAGGKLYAIQNGHWKDFVSAVIEAAKANDNTPPAFFETYNWRTIAANAYQKISSL